MKAHFKVRVRRNRVGRFSMLFSTLCFTGCGLVNGFGGPWPPTSTTGDGGPTPFVDGGVCAGNTHNGGDGTCVPVGECIPTFFLEDDGRCSAWTQEPTLSPARTRLTLTSLTDGRVLAVSGRTATSVVPDANLYIPDESAWAPPSGTVVGRSGHRALAIPGNRVLVIGGRDADDVLVAETAFFRADQNTMVAGSALLSGRVEHAVVALGTRVFVLGGHRGDDVMLAAVEELVGGAFQSAPFALATARAGHEAVALDDGRALVCGGEGAFDTVLASCELIAADGSSRDVAAAMTDARMDFTATRLANGRVLVVGGTSDDAGGFAPLRTAELYDPVVDTWTDVGFLSVPRTRHGAVLLSDGRVLVVGGFGNEELPLASVEIFDPTAGAFVDGPSLTSARGEVALAALGDGGALVVQGSSFVDDSAIVTTTERYRIAD